MSYSANDDYCGMAKGWQAVPSADETRNSLAARGKDSSDAAVQGYREGTKYPCDDSYQMGTINDNHIFVSTTDNQHQQILNGEAPTADGGVSGYFTDQATVDNCTHGGTLDNGQLNRELQVAPFQADASAEPAYKPHTDCFKINPDKLEQNYGTRDFNAALAKCDANNQFGEGGGNQGFNPNLSEMMSNGCLEHDPSKGFSDSSISKLDAGMQNEGALTNSTVSQNTYDGMMQDARDRASDCVKNNTEHPSQEVNDATGYDHNPNPVQGMTGNGTPVASNTQNQQNGQSNQAQQPSANKNNQNQQNGQSNQAQQPSANKNNQNQQNGQSNQAQQPSANENNQNQQNGQAQTNADKNMQKPAQAKSSEGHNSGNGGQTQGNQSQSQGHDSGGSSGMSTKAANTDQTASGSGKQNSSDGMSTKAADSGQSSGQGSSGGMSTTAAGQSSSAPSNSSGQSHGSGQSM